MVVEITSEVLVHGFGVDVFDRDHAWVVLVGLSGVVAVEGFEAGVQTPHCFSSLAEEFFGEAWHGDAEVGAKDVVFAESGVVSKFGCDLVAVVVRELISGGEGEGVVVHCEAFDFAEELFEVHALVFVGECVVELGGGGEAWEVEGVREVVSDIEACGLEVHDGADEDDAVE